jgi:hypothetical protein
LDWNKEQGQTKNLQKNKEWELQMAGKSWKEAQGLASDGSKW